MNPHDDLRTLRAFVGRLRQRAPEASDALDPEVAAALAEELRTLVEPGELAALLARGDLAPGDADAVFEIEAFLLDEPGAAGSAFPELGEVLDGLRCPEPPDPALLAAAAGYSRFVAEVMPPAFPPLPAPPPRAAFEWARPLGLILSLGAAGILGTSLRPVAVPRTLASLLSRPAIATASWLFAPEPAAPTEVPARPASPEDRYRLALEHLRHGRFTPARELLAEAAAAGHPDAMNQLARLHRRGQGGPADLVQARAWLERAAAQDHADSLNDLGVLVADGGGGPQDGGRATRLWRRAAQGGHLHATLNLAWVLSEGPRELRDEREAYDWYLRASLEHSPLAAYRLGVLRLEGRGVDLDEAEGARQIRRAAEGGYRPAMLDTAHLYEQGIGLPRDERAAVAWLRKTAQAGDAQARYELGRRLEQGRGLAPDMEAALDWYRQGAEQGEADCLFRLGELFEQGTGVPASPEVARDYFHRAAAAGHILAPGRLERYRQD